MKKIDRKFSASEMNNQLKLKPSLVKAIASRQVSSLLEREARQLSAMTASIEQLNKQVVSNAELGAIVALSIIFVAIPIFLATCVCCFYKKEQHDE